MKSSEPEQATRPLDQAQVVLRLLVVAHQDRTALAQPGHRPLHHPPPRLAPAGPPTRTPILPDRTDVPDVTPTFDHLMSGRVVVAGVQAPVLLDLIRLRPLHHDRLDRRLQDQVVVDIGPGDYRPQRSALAIDDHTPLGARLGPIRRVGADIIPAAEAGLGHRRVSRLPLPLDAPQLVARGDQQGQDPGHHAALVPALEPVVDGALGPEAARQLVPLAAGPHAKDDPVEGGPPVGRAAAGGLPGPELAEDRADPPPQLLRDLPDRPQ